jgi:glutamate-1-semialdehyde 2,1-aminomutase
MPGGVNSPVRAFKELDMTPLIVKEGRGDTLIDVDDNAYTDFCCSWGSLILGHAPTTVIHTVQEQLRRGTSFGIATPYEKILAEQIIRHLPSIDMIRFVSSGTEAVMSALRLARGFTGKERIVKFNGHYHGHLDSLLIQAGSGATHLPQASSSGIPVETTRQTLSLPFNDTATCRQCIRSQKDIAAVIVEPVAGNMGVVPAKQEFLEMLREETASQGTLLIFDEVITGFRVGLQGAQGHYGITPDLTCLGKVIGGGFPVAAFGGRKEIMEMLAPLGSVYQAGTLSGNPLAMCAGIQTLAEISTPSFYPTLHARTAAFLAPIHQLIQEKKLPVTLNAIGSMFTLFFGPRTVESKEDLNQLDKTRFKQFFHTLFEQGIYFSPSPYEANFLSSAHTDEHLSHAQEVIHSFLYKLPL